MGRMINHAKANERDKMRRSGIEAALAEPLGKPVRTRFSKPGHMQGSGWKQVGDDALAQYQRRKQNLKLAEQIGGRDTTREIVEHIVVQAPEVSPERARELQNRPSVSGRIVRRDPATGEIIAIGRFVREMVGGRYVTRWEDLPA